MTLRPLLLSLVTLLVLGASVQAQDQDQDGDRHEGYYYPPVTSEEVYPARATSLPDSDRLRRIGFVIGVTQHQLNLPFPPQWAMYAKGAEAEKLIIVALNDGALATLYQARAMLAQMTSVARSTELFVQVGVEDYYTFLDLLALMGFRQLTISDGRTYAHQYVIE